MASPAKAGSKNPRSIRDYFQRSFVVPKARVPSQDEPAEEIVVASSSTPPSSSRQPSQTVASDSSPSLPHTSLPPPKRGRPRKHAANSSPSTSSQSSGRNKASRGQILPRKSESQQQRDDQLDGSSGLPPVAHHSSSSASPLRFNINPLDGAADVTPTRDSPYRSSSGPPSKRRVMAAVELPSPKRRSPVHIPPSSTAAHIVKSSAPAAPASSTSTLTSVPISSLVSALPISSTSSSRRIVQNGLRTVTNSDSDDSSDEGLADISTILRPSLAPPYKSRKSSPPGKHSECVDLTSDHYSTTKRASRQQRTRRPLGILPPSPPKKKYKTSLSSLVARHEQWRVQEATIAGLEDAVNKATKRSEEAKQAEGKGAVNGDALLAATGADSDEQQRMLMALGRTEALQEKDQYRFFLDDAPLYPNTPFPLESLPDEPWSKIYEDDATRTHACVSGFAAELAVEYALPMAVTGWMAAQLLHEQREDLCEAYVAILRASTNHSTSVSDTCASLNSMFKTRSLFEHNWENQTGNRVPRGLAHLLKVVQFCAPAADAVVLEALPSYTCAAFLDLALLNVDRDITRDINLRTLVPDCVETMLDALPEDSFQSMIPLAVATFYSSSNLSTRTRCQAITSLPASTARAYLIRRRLALECFSAAKEQKDSDSEDWAKSILYSLRNKPELHVGEQTDYNLLIAMIDVLDIAIASGWTDYADLQPRRPTGPFAPRPAPSVAERTHNKTIDAICGCLQRMMSKIRGSGTSHLRRIEAKSAIERLKVRLEHSVRSRPRPKRNVFDTKGGESGGAFFKQATFDGTSFIKPVAAEEERENESPVIDPLDGEAQPDASTADSLRQTKHAAGRVADAIDPDASTDRDVLSAPSADDDDDDDDPTVSGDVPSSPPVPSKADAVPSARA